MKDSVPIEQRLLEERDELEANRCEHGCFADEFCEDCADESVPWYSAWWKLPCGAHV